MLPPSIEVFKDEVLRSTNDANFVYLPSLCPEDVRQIPPVFIIPGLSGTDAIRKLASKLYYPVYCALFPLTGSSIKDLASDLAKVKYYSTKVMDSNMYIQVCL